MHTKYNNRLTGETSPYLLQHAHNPVNWYPWSEEAFKKAQEEEKLMLISIGYAACHWCHVMEKESFENEKIAEILNQHFVCIKVDREERPDIDVIYMQSVQMMTGQGGWPLTCFALCDGSPVFGGTYFTPEQFLEIITKLNNDYIIQPNYFLEVGERVKEGVRIHEDSVVKSENKDLSKNDLDNAFSQWKNNFDTIYGGENKSPKFPIPSNYHFLLKYFYYTKDTQAFVHALLTLDNMAQGGIYDHLGGGFARYSTDAKWQIPHFEKMLYDNGQLVSLYSEAFKLTKKTIYKNIILETLSFINKEMTSPEGGFYSSLDADSDEEEGKYYAWTKKEIDQLLGNNSPIFCAYYNVTSTGNFENRNIFFTNKSFELIASDFDLTKGAVENIITQSKKILLEARQTRVKPNLDNKIITSWNALMLKGFADAYLATGFCHLLEWAIVNAEFIEQNLMETDGMIHRAYNDGISKIEGFLDDYSFTASAFIKLYQATFDDKWAFLAKKLADYAIRNFYNVQSGMFYYTSENSEKLFSRHTEISDNVIPSSNSVMAHVLLHLSKIFSDLTYAQKAEIMLHNVKENVKENISFFANWGSLYLDFLYPQTEVTITGNQGLHSAYEFTNNFKPDIFLCGTLGKSKLPVVENRFHENETLIYVCKNNVCFPEVKSTAQALQLIEEK